jgi:predicted Zn-ribbon and HTH transcriptional regulator
MKFLKRFCESDAWAGSLLAYDRNIVPKSDKILPDKVEIPYHCEECGFDFFVYNKSADCCRFCNSENIKELSPNEN